MSDNIHRLTLLQCAVLTQFPADCLRIFSWHIPGKERYTLLETNSIQDVFEYIIANRQCLFQRYHRLFCVILRKQDNVSSRRHMHIPIPAPLHD